ncbi:ATP-binding cassette domain-containing protein [Haematomicrobium sanguinis]|uniref:ATP-binding cassette domain-containing protein n=1 Tax=Haematomicrobium sanguinis TaxID=479106 RepID=UPI00047BB250|nr:ATP-binding cassette domain-containing protein [Haematomicrobium sanguinis]
MSAALRRWAFLGLAFSVLTVVAGVGLLGLSGWFIVACALAGAGVFAGFSYVTPSAGVRAFAVSRIGAGYLSSYYLHKYSLYRIGTDRMRVLASLVNSSPRYARYGVSASGALHATMTDVESRAERWQKLTSPRWSFIVAVLGVCVTALFLTPVLALTIALLGAATIGVLTLGQTRLSKGQSRLDECTVLAFAALSETSAAREEFQALGVSGVLRQRYIRALGNVAAAEAELEVLADRCALVIRLLGAVTVVAGVLVSSVMGLGPALVAMVALLLVGLNEQSVALIATMSVGASTHGASRRLAELRDGANGPSTVPSGARVDAEPAHAFTAEARHGRRHAIVGRSGSGKTTALRQLAGESQVVEAPGEPSGIANGLLGDVSGRVFLVGDADHLFSASIAENLFVAGDPELSERAEELLAKLQLAQAGITLETVIGRAPDSAAPDIDAPPRELSVGEQTRLRIVRGILHAEAATNATLLVDEPDFGLDAGNVHLVMRALAELPSTVTVIIAVHSAELAKKHGFETHEAAWPILETGVASPGNIQGADRAMGE